MPDEAPRHYFSADRPIESKDEDLLGRAQFANALASSIMGWKGKDSLVIALYGPWGSGKSSIKNIVLESLRDSKEDIPLIVEFNPWQWAGQDKLAEAFFREIGLNLNSVDKTTEGKRRASRWRAYGAYLKAGSTLADALRNGFFAALLGVGVLGLAGSLLPAELIKQIVVVLAGAFLILAAVFKFGGEFAERMAVGLLADVEAEQLSLSERKKELARLLGEMESSLLVVIDDVDRLATDEIKLLFQLIRSNADFPNIVYLLLFQRNIVEKSLAGIAPFEGKDYLEKIVQVGFDIPQVERPRLDRLLFAHLDAVLEDQIILQRFDKGRWAELFHTGLRPYFQNLRDVYRLVATLSFHVAQFRRGSFEVNPIDLIALEVLRVFESEVYHRLVSAKATLTLDSMSTLNLAELEDQRKRTVQGILACASEGHDASVEKILRQLFPPIERFFGAGTYGTDWNDGWYRDLRVCHHDVFDRYFHMTIPKGDISQTELDRVLALAGDRHALVAELQSLNERGLLIVALDRLDAYKEKIDLQHAEAFCTALVDIGDGLPTNSRGSFEMRPDTQASRIVYWCLRREKDGKKRAEILGQVLRNTTGLYLPIMALAHEARRIEDEGKANRVDRLIEDEADLKELQKICLKKIRHAAESGVLAPHPAMLYILFRWSEWSCKDEPGSWAQELVQTVDGLLQFLTGLLSTTRISDGYGQREVQKIRLSYVESFVPTELIERRLSEITLQHLTEEHQTAVRAFTKALQRRREGKSEDDFWDEERG